MKVNTVLDILDARDERIAKQKELIKKYDRPLISYTLNIAGNIKRTPLLDIIFEEGLYLIVCEVEDSILFKETKKDKTGCTAYLVVDLEIETLKKKMVEIERQTSVARLYDIDVIGLDFKPVSRCEIGVNPRSCIVCNKPYLECRRNKSHSMEDVVAATQKLANEECSILLSNIASYCLIAELSTTPKPGLVDKNNTGSHGDMNFELFLKSTETLTPYLRKEYRASLEFNDKNELFCKMKDIGLMAENAMMVATNGINTHKGAFFSLSTIGCGICYLLSNEEYPTVNKIRSFATEFSSWAQNHNDFHDSNGSKVRDNNKNVGIYYEASRGYPSIFDRCEKYLDSFKGDKYQKTISSFYGHKDFDYCTFKKTIEEKAIRVFCTLLSCVDDSNIIHRGGLDALYDMHKYFQKFDDEKLSIDDLKNELLKSDETFIGANLSPGGTADLLTITLFIMVLRALNVVR